MKGLNILSKVFYLYLTSNGLLKGVTFGSMYMQLACSRRSDGGERCEVKRSGKNKSEEGGEVREGTPPLLFIANSLLRTVLNYLNAWNRLTCNMIKFIMCSTGDL